MEKGRQRNSRLNVRFVLLFSVALLLVVMVTFGMTLSYFGGKSQGYTADFILKAGIHFKENEQGREYQKVTFDSNVLVPGTTIKSTCLMTISSGVTNNLANTAVNGLLRADFSVTGRMAQFVSLNYGNDAPIYVYKGTTSADMTEANKVARLVQANIDGDTHFYLVGTDVTIIQQNTNLYEILCKDNGGEVSLVFGLSFSVNNVSDDGFSIFSNGFSGETAEFQANFLVIQSEFYDSTQGNSPLAKIYRNAKPVFNEPDGITS